jgi:hypothetical protein
MFFMQKIIVFSVSLFLLCACNSEESVSNEDLLKEASEKKIEPQKKMSDEVVGSLINSIPSPLEVSALIKETNKVYAPEYLNDARNYSMYTSSYGKALNLGIYGTDLGYISLYNHTADAISYISAIKSLSEQLGIGQFYDFEQIKKLALNANNIDSLLFLTTKNFENINSYLHEKGRSEQSVLILTGGWLEALHLTCEIAHKSQSRALFERIAEQKITFEQIYLLLDNFAYDPKINELVKQLKPLKAVFDQIEITYIIKEQKVKDEKGVLSFESIRESTVHYTPEQILAITKLVENIRGSII